MAAYHLITQDAVVQITLGGVANGSAPVYGTDVISLIGDLRNVSLKDDLETVSVPGAGGTREKLRSKRGSSSATLEKFVLSTGCDYVSKLGYYAKLEFKELSTMSAFKSMEGIITAWEWGGGDDEQMERIEIRGDAEHA